MKYKIKQSSSFKKSFKKYRHNKKVLLELKQILLVLSDGLSLDEKYKDHALKGEYLGMRECHIFSDILLIYAYKDNKLILVLVDLGSHSSLF